MSLTIKEGEFVSLLGPSGCGKTTILRMVAGLVEPSRGRILIGDDDVTALPPNKRGLGLVFQSYALFPHLTVFENVAFGLRRRKVAGAELDKRVKEALARVRLDAFGERYPRQLSGGQQQRVAIARALAPQPRVLLFDEPLSNLDAQLRDEMQIELKRLQRGLGITTLFVTHDQGEALSMSDRVGVHGERRHAAVCDARGYLSSPRDRFRRRLHRKTEPAFGNGRFAQRSRRKRAARRRPHIAGRPRRCTRRCGRRCRHPPGGGLVCAAAERRTARSRAWWPCVPSAAHASNMWSGSPMTSSWSPKRLRAGPNSALAIGSEVSLAIDPALGLRNAGGGGRMIRYRHGMMLLAPLALVLAGFFLLPVLMMLPTSFREYAPGLGTGDPGRMDARELHAHRH